MAGIVRGTIGGLEDGRVKVGTAGVGHRPQVIGMTAWHVSAEMRGTAGDGRVWGITVVCG